MAPSSQQIRQLLQEAYDDIQLRNFCYDSFPEVHPDLSSGMKKSAAIQVLIEYCSKHGKISLLLDLVRAQNPYKYREIFQDIEPNYIIEVTMKVGNMTKASCVFLGENNYELTVTGQYAESTADVMKAFIDAMQVAKKSLGVLPDQQV